MQRTDARVGFAPVGDRSSTQSLGVDAVLMEHSPTFLLEVRGAGQPSNRLVRERQRSKSGYQAK